MMNIIVNGTRHELEAKTLAGALEALSYEGAIVATALNGRFIPASARHETALEDGDAIEILAPMQGG